MTVVAPTLLDKILEDVERLSPRDRVRLIQQVAEKLVTSDSPSSPRYLERGKFKGKWEIRDEDFKAAEWYAADGEAELDDP